MLSTGIGAGWKVLSAVAIVLQIAAVPAAPAGAVDGSASEGVTCRVSVTDRNLQTDGPSINPRLSATGRHVAFTSGATNLISADDDAGVGVFVRDRSSGRVTRVSAAVGGEPANGSSYVDGISADGRYVAFTSYASDLVPEDTNGVSDVFVRDLITGTTNRVSVSSGGAQADYESSGAGISGNGRFVAFTSWASDLVPGENNVAMDVYVRDLVTSTTTRVSASTDGTQGNWHSYHPQLSYDGRFIVFASLADNLVPGDVNDAADAFVRDRLTGTTRLVSVSLSASSGNERSGDPAISPDGRSVAFWSSASDLVPRDTNGVGDIFVRELLAGRTTRVSASSTGEQADNGSVRVAISGDGRYVAFTSSASNLVPADTNGVGDVFVHDRATTTTIRVSVSTGGRQVTYETGANPVDISADGRHIGFSSEDTGLVLADTNGHEDVFMRDLVPGIRCR
ncbi:MULTISPECIES: TolB family protein [Catenuloplanes]|uniref:Tol biopolymer transport system component n=1 Tax=Catenuloplanes niger TaxID=587534 RepID=A0AAE4D076_9ACTN|nr:hypothetical protein [Catenuloplanes niger]MDR7327644.1 Tol biopolymer transport system component [Catenuloplanes niger]